MRSKTPCSFALIYLLAVAITAALSSVPALAKAQYKVLATISGGLWSGLTLDSKGNLYGATNAGGQYSHGSIYEVSPNANGTWTTTTIYSFNGTDGDNPAGGLVFDAVGNLYGVTFGGGAYDYGTVFELTPGVAGWSLTTLYSFCRQNDCADGSTPDAGLAQDEDGNLYGTANGGLYGLGVVFEMSPGLDGWTESVLYTFGSRTDDATESRAPLALRGSRVYGTSESGGAHNAGSVFEVKKDAGGWKERVLHSFCPIPCKGGGGPKASVILDASGDIYSTSEGGPSACDGAPCGTVFELTRDLNGRWIEQVLYDFSSPRKGFEPATGVVFDEAGNLYGTTALGGAGMCFDGCGVVYKLTPTDRGKWKSTVLYEFMSSYDSPPDGQLVIDPKGNLYGTAVNIVYEVTP